MIQNRHQATHTKEPLLIIAIKIQQHLDTMPSLSHYSMPAIVNHLKIVAFIISRFEIGYKHKIILQRNLSPDLLDFYCSPQNLAYFSNHDILLREVKQQVLH